MLPTFLICGAMKAGTTSLYRYMRQHPEVCMSWEKEIGFFAGSYDMGLEWYRRHFDGCSDQKAIGEACPQYISDPRVPKRLVEIIPHVKLIFLLREPVRRAYSHYLFDLSLGKQTDSFSKVIRTERGYRSYVKRGFYAVQLERFLERFDRDQLLVLFAEHFRANTLDTVRRCFGFLGVDSAFVPDVTRKFNVTRRPRSRLASRAADALKRMSDAIRPAMPLSIQRVLKPMHESFRRSLTVRAELPPLSEGDRAYLSEVYEPHNARLSRLLDVDLTQVWRAPGS